jgi:cell division septation protein DedD
MRNSETGELEFVVGNRQLLSGFFIVVLLFAVAFAMGYVVGQNSPKALHAAAAEPAPVTLTPADARPQPGQSSAATPSQASPATPEAAASNAPAKGDPSPQTTATAQNPASAAPVPELPPGSYWQVMAVPEHEAEIMKNTLKEKGFPALLSQGPKDLMRVLVGPYNDRPSMGKAKTELENLGLRPIMR